MNIHKKLQRFYLLEFLKINTEIGKQERRIEYSESRKIVKYLLEAIKLSQFEGKIRAETFLQAHILNSGLGKRL